MNAGLRDFESRIGVDHIELHAQRWRDLSKQRAPLHAVYGPGGTFDAQRKANLSTIKMEIRAEATLSGSKLTVDEIDSMAHADDRYVEFITKAVQDRTKLAEIEDEMKTLEWVINREQALIRAYSSEPR